MKDHLDDSWQHWLKTNLANGCDALELLQILQRNQFATKAIKEAMGSAFPQAPFAVLAQPAASQGISPGVDYAALTKIAITTHAKAKKIDSTRLQLYSVDDFLTAVECDELLTCINSKLRPSTVTVNNGDDLFRTSETCDLCNLDAPFIAEVDQRIATALGINLSYSEGIQGQRYSVGQEFKPHTDYFEPGSKEFDKFAKIRGQRTWTFMIYLQDTTSGGATHFPNIDQTFYPKKGQAVIWNNLYASGKPNPDSIHHGQPVKNGSKAIITKWFRDKGDGTMFS